MNPNTGLSEEQKKMLKKLRLSAEEILRLIVMAEYSNNESQMDICVNEIIDCCEDMQEQYTTNWH